jgi:hypothetical protein
VEGERTRAERLRASLIYDSIEDFRGTGATISCQCAEVYQSAFHAGISPDDLFGEIAALSSERGARFFISFIERDEDKSLRAFGFVVHQTPDGVVIK